VKRGLPVLPALLGAVLLTVLTVLALGGCGAAPPAPPGPSATAAPAPQLPWPVGDAAGVALLQERVDAGSQPWLLDPESVATAFAAAAYGWSDATAELPGGTAAPGLAVILHGPGGVLAHLVLEQPGRTGPHGVWVVSRAGVPTGS
jgi:hypothetical protein